MVAFRSLKRARIKEDSQFAGVLLVSPLLQLTPVGPRAFISLSGYFPGGHCPAVDSFVLSNVGFLVLVGIVRLRDGLRDRYPVEDYLDLFDLAAYQIHQGLQASSAEEQSRMTRIIIGTASGQLPPGPLPPQAGPPFPPRAPSALTLAQLLLCLLGTFA